jgi:GNAT superfamily N-acetyltransferase
METVIVPAIVENTNFYLATIFAGQTIEFVCGPDISYARSHWVGRSYNYVYETHFPDTSIESGQQSSYTVDERIDQIKSLYGTQEFTWWVGPGDSPDNLATLLQHHGFINKPEETAHLMYCDLHKFQELQELQSSNNLEIKMVTDLNSLHDFAQLHHISDREFDDIWKPFSAKLFQPNSPIEICVGYINDTPVTTGLITFFAKVAGISYVATCESERRKGYATTLMRSLIQRAKDTGFSYATLTSTVDANNLYVKLGFQNCGVPLQAFVLG